MRVSASPKAPPRSASHSNQTPANRPATKRRTTLSRVDRNHEVAGLTAEGGSSAASSALMPSTPTLRRDFRNGDAALGLCVTAYARENSRSQDEPAVKED